MKQIVGSPLVTLNNFLNIINVVYRRLVTFLYYKHQFSNVGKRCTIHKPILFSNINHVSIGNRVSIREGARIEVVCPVSDVVILVGNNVNIEQNVHIVGMRSICIEDNVSITGNCSIVDVIHPFDDISVEPKIGARVDSHSLGVRIGMGSFIGYGAHISPGVHIGRNCIVGAMSVVTKSVPDYCVVAGNPAKIIKKYNFETANWERIGQ